MGYGSIADDAVRYVCDAEQGFQMERMIGIKDVAAQAGVHYSTVSLALRNSPKISESTRKRICEVARRLGYVPDPFLKALSAYRQRTRPQACHGGIAIITDHFFEPDSGWSSEVWGDSVARHVVGIKKAFETTCSQLGFSANFISLDHSQCPIDRIPKWLRARGIECIVLAPFRNPREELELDIQDFSVVAMGYTVASAPFHHVAQNYFENTRRQILAIQHRGYKRIGLYLSQDHDQQTRGRIRAAFMLEAQNNPDLFIPEILDKTHYTPSQWRSWTKRERPDALMCVEYAMNKLQEAGVKIPQTLACSSMSLMDPEWMSGMEVRNDIVVREAVHRVVSLWQRGQRGRPGESTHFLIDGLYQDGPSLPIKDAPRTR